MYLVLFYAIACATIIGSLCASHKQAVANAKHPVPG